MITKEINELAQLWFTQIVINASKTESGVQGNVSAHGGFVVSTGTEIERVAIHSDLTEFLVGLSTKLGIDPTVVYQGICDSLENLYNKQTHVIT